MLLAVILRKESHSAVSEEEWRRVRKLINRDVEWTGWKVETQRHRSGSSLTRRWSGRRWSGLRVCVPSHNVD